MLPYMIIKKITAVLVAGRLSFFIFKTGYNGNNKHSDLNKIVPCNIFFHNTTSLHTEEGKKDYTSSELRGSNRTDMVLLRAFAEYIIAHLIFFVNKNVMISKKEMKEQKSPTRGDFTPSEQPPGRRLFEARREFRPLRRAA